MYSLFTAKDGSQSIIDIDTSAHVPLDPSNRHYAKYQDWLAAGHVPETVVEGPTAEDVSRERGRRLALGFDYDFGDEHGVYRIGTTSKHLESWDEVTTAANAAIATANSSLPIAIVTETGPRTVTALEWQSILLAAAAFRQPIWHASFSTDTICHTNRLCKRHVLARLMVLVQ